MPSWTPHDYQKKIIKFIVSQAAGAVWADPGLGKTSTTLAAFKVLRDKGYVTRALVVAPLRPAYSVWPGEVEKWDEFKHLKVGVLHGPRKAEVLADKTVDIHVINPEGLAWLFAQPLRATGSAPWPWQMLVIDESTRFKHTNTARFKTLKPWLGMFPRRYILTGTPAPNGLLDLFGQIYLLDGGASLGRYITHYRLAFFDNPDRQGWAWVPRHGAPEEIYKRLEPLTLRMSAEDYLSLPDLVMNTVEVTLPAAARKVYDQMEIALLAQVAGGTVVASNAAAATGKCRQIANGGIYTAPGKWAEVHRAKLEATEEIVEELNGQPVIVAYEFDHDRERLQAAFPGAPHIGGGVPAGRFREIEAAWNRGEIPVLLAQPQSVAHGLNLQRGGSHLIFHSLTWNLEDYDQIIRRIYRQGQEKRVFVHHIVARDTVDEAIMLLLAKKDRTQRALLDALKDYTERRS